jgi:hypothetical protein
MQSDGPIVDEVRRRRAELSSRFDDDLQAYGQHLMEYQRQHPGRLVSQITVVPAEQHGEAGVRSGAIE